MNNHRHKRNTMWARDRRCHWCHEETILPTVCDPAKPPANMATLDHFYHQFDPRRKEPDGEIIYVLACYRCNQKRGAEAVTTALRNGTHPPHNKMQPMTMEQLKPIVAAKGLYDCLKGNFYPMVAVGVGKEKMEPILIIYTNQSNILTLPTQWEGYPIQLKCISRPKLLED